MSTTSKLSSRESFNLARSQAIPSLSRYFTDFTVPTLARPGSLCNIALNGSPYGQSCRDIAWRGNTSNVNEYFTPEPKLNVSLRLALSVLGPAVVQKYIKKALESVLESFYDGVFYKLFTKDRRYAKLEPVKLTSCITNTTNLNISFSLPNSYNAALFYCFTGYIRFLFIEFKPFAILCREKSLTEEERELIIKYCEEGFIDITKYHDWKSNSHFISAVSGKPSNNWYIWEKELKGFQYDSEFAPIIGKNKRSSLFTGSKSIAQYNEGFGRAEPLCLFSTYGPSYTVSHIRTAFRNAINQICRIKNPKGLTWNYIVGDSAHVDAKAVLIYILSEIYGKENVKHIFNNMRMLYNRSESTAITVNGVKISASLQELGSCVPVMEKLLQAYRPGKDFNSEVFFAFHKITTVYIYELMKGLKSKRFLDQGKAALQRLNELTPSDIRVEIANFSNCYGFLNLSALFQSTFNFLGDPTNLVINTVNSRMDRALKKAGMRG